ncbi:MAG TPA: hypothetical protein VHF08_01635 [Nitrososphaeraceae archaeon]|nr:hypothetical protein [Nitrososphaeraceae archaeon]
MVDNLDHRNLTLSSKTTYLRTHYLDIIKMPHFFTRAYHSQSIFLITIVTSTILLLSSTGILFSSAFTLQTPGTQNEEQALEVPGNISSNIDTKDTALNKTGTDLPILEQLSDKGNYLIQVRWGQDPSLLAASGFDMEIVFLNASESEATPGSFPIKETNVTGDSFVGSGGYTDPSIVQRMVPIESYDITVYSDNGEQLWKKANQPVQAGRAYERITFENPYKGGITIQISNIKAAGNMGGTIGGPLSGPDETNPTDDRAETDSINFTATVVEERS